MYTYEMMSAVAQRSGGRHCLQHHVPVHLPAPGPGPASGNRARWCPRTTATRVYFAITPEGEAYLDRLEEEYRRYIRGPGPGCWSRNNRKGRRSHERGAAGLFPAAGPEPGIVPPPPPGGGWPPRSAGRRRDYRRERPEVGPAEVVQYLGDPAETARELLDGLDPEELGRARRRERLARRVLVAVLILALVGVGAWGVHLWSTPKSMEVTEVLVIGREPS